jgi:predicted transcriptional regulator
MIDRMIETIFLSEKRNSFMLMLLEEGETDMQKFRESHGVTPSSMLPQIKKLREEGMVHKNDNGIYSLTTIGRLIVSNMVDLSLVFHVFDQNPSYWYSRDLSLIPDYLLDRIGELGDLTFIEPDLDHMYELPEMLILSLKKSSCVKAIVPFFHPMQIGLYADLVDSGKSLDLLLTESVYSMLQKDYTQKIHALQSSENVSIMVCEDSVKPVSMNMGSNFVYISLLNSSGKYDHRDIFGSDESAVRWANALLEYYSSMEKSQEKG